MLLGMSGHAGPGGMGMPDGMACCSEIAGMRARVAWACREVWHAARYERACGPRWHGHAGWDGMLLRNSGHAGPGGMGMPGGVACCSVWAGMRARVA